MRPRPPVRWRPLAAVFCVLVLAGVAPLALASPPPLGQADTRDESADPSAAPTVDQAAASSGETEAFDPAAAAAQMEDILPPREPVALPNPWWWVPWAVGALVLVLLIFAAWWWSRRRREMSDEPFAQLPPPYDEAQTGLRQARELLDDPSADRYVVAVSRVLRRYIERALDLPAPERTTEEFLPEAARHRVLQGDLATRLESFLYQCDLVKFARQDLARANREELLDAAHRFVEATHEKLQTPAAAAATTEPGKERTAL